MLIVGCVHESLVTDEPPNGGPVTPPPSGGGSTIPCDVDSVYFANTIQPLLVATCAIPSCHDSATASDGVVLDTYENIIATGDISPGNPQNSDLYEVLIDDDPDDRMPPPDSGVTISTEQIQAIFTWIQQGAKNNSCDEGECITDNMSFSADIFTIVQNKCLGCHSGNAPQGGILLSNYENIKARVDDGSFFGAINHEAGFTPMPFEQDKLPQCDIDQIKSWIDAGAPNN